jgi:tight adherence protein B
MGPLVAAVLLGLAIQVVFTGMWRRGQAVDPVDARLAQYAGAGLAAPEAGQTPRERLLRKSARRGGLSAKLAEKLTQADLPLTVVEFALVMLLAGGLGFAAGWWRGGALLGCLGGAVLGVAPFIYLNMRASQRRKAFNLQLPDVLTLMVGALRAGYGITQTLAMLVERLPQPASAEFDRAMRGVGLGLPVTRALNDMAARVGSDDLYLVVTAMTVQQELGGNLAQILETIAETIRGRIRIKREIGVMTSQQRITGIVLSCLPVGAVLVINTINPEYMSGLFTTTIGRIMAGGALFLMFVGYIIIRKIVDIEV